MTSVPIGHFNTILVLPEIEYFVQRDSNNKWNTQQKAAYLNKVGHWEAPLCFVSSLVLFVRFGYGLLYGTTALLNTQTINSRKLIVYKFLSTVISATDSF